MSPKPQPAAPAELWEVLGAVAGKLPGVEAASNSFARGTIQRLLGFWMMWHMFGGLDGVDVAYTRSSAYRQKVEFYAVFKMPVEDFWPDMAARISAGARVPWTKGRPDVE